MYVYILIFSSEQLFLQILSSPIHTTAHDDNIYTPAPVCTQLPYSLTSMVTICIQTEVCLCTVH